MMALTHALVRTDRPERSNMTAPEVDQPDDEIETVGDPAEFGGLSVEDDPEGTVDPSELAGTAQDEDEDVS